MDIMDCAADADGTIAPAAKLKKAPPRAATSTSSSTSVPMMPSSQASSITKPCARKAGQPRSPFSVSSPIATRIAQSPMMQLAKAVPPKREEDGAPSSRLLDASSIRKIIGKQALLQGASKDAVVALLADAFDMTDEGLEAMAADHTYDEVIQMVKTAALFAAEKRNNVGSAPKAAASSEAAEAALRDEEGCDVGASQEHPDADVRCDIAELDRLGNATTKPVALAPPRMMMMMEKIFMRMWKRVRKRTTRLTKKKTRANPRRMGATLRWSSPPPAMRSCC